MNTFLPADILLPKNTDINKWSVVACDQYTSDSDYWKTVEAFVAKNPSALRIILPEVYLNQSGVSDRINLINRQMDEYLQSDIFETLSSSYVYLERTMKNGKIRRGLVGMIDLEAYSFEKGSQTLVRATEGTVLERIPPRVKIRQDASLELSHIMILIDDEKKTVIEPIVDMKGGFRQLYDFDLMQNGGHIAGWQVDNNYNEIIIDRLNELENDEIFNDKYKLTCKKALAYAVGDGNHSLATAKTCYENLKKTMNREEYLKHPSRYALAEIVNLHDSALEFEPIHRVVFNTAPEKLIQAMVGYFNDIEITDSKRETRENEQFIQAVTNNSDLYIYIKNPPHNLSVGTLQMFLDVYLSAEHGEVDYIHGEDVVKKLVSDSDKNIGFLLGNMDKNDLFKTVVLDGALPRKTFSMGHAEEKRFYLEARRIK